MKSTNLDFEVIMLILDSKNDYFSKHKELEQLGLYRGEIELLLDQKAVLIRDLILQRLEEGNRLRVNGWIIGMKKERDYLLFSVYEVRIGSITFTVDNNLLKDFLGESELVRYYRFYP